MVTPTLNGRVSDTAVRLSRLNGGGADAGPRRRGERRSSVLESISRASPRAAPRVAPGGSGSARRRGRNPNQEGQPVRGSALLRDFARRLDAQLVLRRDGVAAECGV